MNWLDERIEAELREREARHLLRRVRSTPAGAIDLSSNDYLALSGHPRVLEGARRALEEDGAGARASRLLGGEHPSVASLEEALAAWKDPLGHARALVFSSGYAANMGAVTALARAGDLLLCDKRNHASLIDACRLAQANGAALRFYGTSGKLRALLESFGGSGPDSRTWIVSDTVYSMDGDIADVPGLMRLAREFSAGLLLDDAHGTGTLGARGAGALEHFGIGWPRDVGVVVVGTLSKAVGSQGGFVAASPMVISWLVNASRSFIYSTGVAPSTCGAARAALQVLEEEPERLQSLRRNACELAQNLQALGYSALYHETPIIPVAAETPERALRWSAFLAERGVICAAVRPPTVRRDGSRLRLSAHSGLGQDDLNRIVEAFVALRKSSLFED
jgi:8-amino-7-oxononanoate synthase